MKTYKDHAEEQCRNAEPDCAVMGVALDRGEVV
jgi:hypothetical protein